MARLSFCFFTVRTGFNSEFPMTEMLRGTSMEQHDSNSLQSAAAAGIMICNRLMMLIGNA